MRVLVTGGAGYVGSPLVSHLLARGHAVHVLDSLLHGGESLLPMWANPHFSFTKADVRDRAAVRAALADVDAVVHLAAIVGDPACARQPAEAEAVNLDASRALVAEASHAGVQRFVFASTCSNYGRMPDPDQLADEDTALHPISLYAETKVAVERHLAEHANGMATTALRFATVFGVSPRMRFDLTVNEFTLAALTQGRLQVYGEQFWRPYVHVVDVARAVAAVLEAPRARVAGQVFNVGATTQNHRKQEIAELACAAAAPNATVEYIRRDEDPRDYRVSFTRIHDTLGFRTTRSVPDGVAEVARLVQSGALRDTSANVYRN
ncbi:MAG: NAD-dependent epimerase/dehydratase family protein [Gemmatirosa sp.]